MKLSLHKAATEFKTSRETLRRGLRSNGVPVTKGSEYSLLEIFNALAGDLKLERVRAARLDNEERERKAAIEKGELCNLQEVERVVWLEGLLPLKQAMDAMPASIAAQCNPDSPALAREVLTNWVTGFKNGIREKVEAELSQG